MESLEGAVAGAYRVVTVTAEYIIDFDRMVMRRSPKEATPEAALLRRDAEEVTLIAVPMCRVGISMHLIIDLNVSEVAFTTRTTTAVQSIDPLEGALVDGPQ